MSIRGRSLTTTGRSQFGRTVVTSADLLAASGLLTIDLTSSGAVAGPWIEIEAGASLSGIQVTRDGDDLTNVADDLVTGLFIVASPVMPYMVTVVDEDVAVPAWTRLWVPSLAVPGTRANGVLGQHQITPIWDPGLLRWRVPWLAP